MKKKSAGIKAMVEKHRSYDTTLSAQELEDIKNLADVVLDFKTGTTVECVSKAINAKNLRRWDYYRVSVRFKEAARKKRLEYYNNLQAELKEDIWRRFNELTSKSEGKVNTIRRYAHESNTLGGSTIGSIVGRQKRSRG